MNQLKDLFKTLILLAFIFPVFTVSAQDSDAKTFEELARENCNSDTCLNLKLERYNSCTTDKCREFTIGIENHLKTICENSEDDNCSSNKTISYYVNCSDMNCMDKKRNYELEQLPDLSKESSGKKFSQTNNLAPAKLPAPSASIKIIDNNDPLMDASAVSKINNETKEVEVNNKPILQASTTTNAEDSPNTLEYLKEQNLTACKGDQGCEEKLEEYFAKVDPNTEIAATSGQQESLDDTTVSSDNTEKVSGNPIDLDFLKSSFNVTEAQVLGSDSSDRESKIVKSMCNGLGVGCTQIAKDYFKYSQIMSFYKKNPQYISQLDKNSKSYGFCTIRISEKAQDAHYLEGPSTVPRAMEPVYVGVAPTRAECIKDANSKISMATAALTNANQPGKKNIGWHPLEGQFYEEESHIKGQCYSVINTPKKHKEFTLSELLSSNGTSYKKHIKDATQYECRESCKKAFFELDGSKGQDVFCFIGDVLTTRKSSRHMAVTKYDFEGHSSNHPKDSCVFRYKQPSESFGTRMVTYEEQYFDSEACIQTCDTKYEKAMSKLNKNNVKNQPEDFKCIYKPSYQNRIISLTERVVKSYPDLSGKSPASSGQVCEFYNYVVSKNPILSFETENKVDCLHLGHG
ncbi:MAG: hypothetical protein KC478_14195, partial [Bacteriovoracaceae bacterium]|nr:hypothetical protein [Bacteriovoracaceae bacterium]